LLAWHETRQSITLGILEAIRELLETLELDARIHGAIGSQRATSTIKNSLEVVEVASPLVTFAIPERA